MSETTGSQTRESGADDLRGYYPGCGDNSCLVFKPQGMGTNGGCRCHSDRENARKAIQVLWNQLQNIKSRLSESEAARGKAEEDADRLAVSLDDMSNEYNTNSSDDVLKKHRQAYSKRLPPPDGVKA